MKLKALMTAGALLVLLSLGAMAASIPYPNPGTVAPEASITAAANGPLVLYYFGFSASHVDWVSVTDITSAMDSGWLFDNQTTTPGTSITALTSVHEGDVLEFRLWDASTGTIYSSIAANSPDGINHFYSAPYTTGGPAGIPPGLFVGAEDLAFGKSDLDYNDHQFVLTIGPLVPESSSMALFGTGLVGLGLLLRRRRQRVTGISKS